MDESSFIFGVDLDGVVGDFYGAMRKVAAEWLGKPLDSLTTEVSYGLEEWGIEEYGGYERLHRFAVTQRNLYRDMPPIPGAPAALRKLSRRGIRIRIITHRLFLKYTHEVSAHQTIEWLDHWDVPYWDLNFMKDKCAVGAHLYIDDAPDNIKQLRAQGEKTIIFTNSTNKDLPGPRAANWDEAERLVSEVLEEWKTGSVGLF
jgi:5'(3')-deoxyribonucleotidase